VEDFKQFIGQLIRLALIVAAILAGREVLIRLPMVADLERLPLVGVSAYELITAIAYVAVLVALMGFVKQVEVLARTRPDAFPWQGLLTQTLILFAIVLFYGGLRPFARSLLGPERYWAYSAALLLLAVVPIVGVGRLLYEFLSKRIERWES
jgi:hypothetical protein